MSEPFGRHLIAELYQCNPDTLNQLSKVKEIILNAIQQVNPATQNLFFYQKDQPKLSGICIYAKSHLAIHVFTDQSYVSLDFFTFDPRININEVYEDIANKLQASWALVKELQRGGGEILELND